MDHTISNYSASNSFLKSIGVLSIVDSDDCEQAALPCGVEQWVDTLLDDGKENDPPHEDAVLPCAFEQWVNELHQDSKEKSKPLNAYAASFTPQSKVPAVLNKPIFDVTASVKAKELYKELANAKVGGHCLAEYSLNNKIQLASTFSGPLSPYKERWSKYLMLQVYGCEALIQDCQESHWRESYEYYLSMWELATWLNSGKLPKDIQADLLTRHEPRDMLRKSLAAVDNYFSKNIGNPFLSPNERDICQMNRGLVMTQLRQLG